MKFEAVPHHAFGPGSCLAPDAGPSLPRWSRTIRGISSGPRPNFLTAETRSRRAFSGFTLLMLALSAVGCSAVRPLKGGAAGSTFAPLHAGGNAPVFTLQQPENPAAASTQHIERTVDQEREFEAVPIATFPAAPGGTNSYQPPAYVPRKYTTRTVERIDTSLGASQKDTSREISAQIASMRPVQWAGIILVAAALSMFWAPIRAVTQSRTLQIFTGAAGMILIFLPLMITASPNMFALAAIAGIAAPAIYHFVHRHGRLQGFVDANKDGLDDRLSPASPLAGPAAAGRTTVPNPT